MKKDLSLQLSLKDRMRVLIVSMTDSYTNMFSLYFGEEVSKLHVMKITHALLAFTVLVFTYGNALFSVVFLAWFIATLIDCKKAGIH